MAMTSTHLTADHRRTLKGDVSAIIDKAQLSHERFTSEVRRAMSGARLEL
jgi:hypothetical protein